MNAYDIKSGVPVARQKNPVRNDSWLMPGGCTDIEPPEYNKETHNISFNGTEWIVAEIPQPEQVPEPEPNLETYKDKRLKEYGTLEEQIEFITENGLEAWQTKVSGIKAKYPKQS